MIIVHRWLSSVVKIQIIINILRTSSWFQTQRANQIRHSIEWISEEQIMIKWIWKRLLSLRALIAWASQTWDSVSCSYTKTVQWTIPYCGCRQDFSNWKFIWGSIFFGSWSLLLGSYGKYIATSSRNIEAGESRTRIQSIWFNTMTIIVIINENKSNYLTTRATPRCLFGLSSYPGGSVSLVGVGIIPLRGTFDDSFEAFDFFGC